MTYILDTHALYWLLSDSPKLSEAARAAMSDRSAGVVVPILVCAELRHLQNRGKVRVDVNRWIAEMQSQGLFAVHPFDLDVLRLFPDGLEIHDSMIVATALLYREQSAEAVAVVTCDQAIVNSRLVDTLW